MKAAPGPLTAAHGSAVHAKFEIAVEAIRCDPHYAFAHSITLDGEWHTIDLEYILENFSRGTVRDGNGYLQWFRSKHDPKSPEKQMRLRSDLARIKFDTNMTLTQILKAMVDGLSLWCKIGDNDKGDPVKLHSFYELMEPLLAGARCYVLPEL